MSGPTATQLQLQGAQTDFYKEGAAQSQTVFNEDQSLVALMNAVYEPIFAKGPNQEGFSPAEKSNLDSQAIEGTATNYTHAASAVGEQIAAQGGGDNPLATTVVPQIAEAAAGEESREESQIVAADYEQGHRNFEEAGQGLAETSSQLNPTSYETAATGAGSAAETTAKDIVSEQNSWMAPVFGAIGAVGTAAGGDYAAFLNNS